MSKQIRRHSRRVILAGLKLAYHGAIGYALTGVAGPKWAAAANAAEKAVQEIQTARTTP